MALAGEFLRMEEIQGGEGAAQRLYLDEASALRALRETPAPLALLLSAPSPTG